MTHAELVALAARWLRGTRRCAVVSTESGDTYSGERPDAIGWVPRGDSILVECKTSHEDFVADQRKPHRIVGGMGRERWYLAEDGVLRIEKMPATWGLLVVRRGRIYRVVQAEVRPLDPAYVRPELTLLVALTRRAVEGREMLASAAAPPRFVPAVELPLLGVKPSGPCSESKCPNKGDSDVCDHCDLPLCWDHSSQTAGPSRCSSCRAPPEAA